MSPCDHDECGIVACSMPNHSIAGDASTQDDIDDIDVNKSVSYVLRDVDEMIHPLNMAPKKKAAFLRLLIAALHVREAGGP